jgi:hypothetical protein
MLGSLMPRKEKRIWHLLKSTGLGSMPKKKIYGIAFDRSNSWMSFSHITWGHLWMMVKQPFIK